MPAPRKEPGTLPAERPEEQYGFTVEQPSWRELTASRVAYAVLWMFGVALLVSFGFGFYVLSVSQRMDDQVVELSLAYLKTIGTIFGPLLAFILGYYFSKKED
jgi:hypothetical protein